MPGGRGGSLEPRQAARRTPPASEGPVWRRGTARADPAKAGAGPRSRTDETGSSTHHGPSARLYQHGRATEKGAAEAAPFLRSPSNGSGGRFLGLFLPFLARDLLAGGLVDHLHGEAHLAALVEAHQLDEHLVAFLHHVSGLVHPVMGEL